MNSTLSTADRERLLRMARAAALERRAPKSSPIERVDRGGRLALSFAQQRLWLLEQLGELGSTYHIRIRRRLRGPLDRAALVRALDAVVARHESLRTTFAQVDGIPEQRIAPADAGFRLVEHDLAGRADAEARLERLMAEEGGAPFDLERGPLIRGRLVRLAVDDHVLLVTMHHIVSDGWSSGVFFGEFSALYAAHRAGTEPELPELPVQYADYAAWQRRWVEGEVLREQADYWKATLGGAPELLELPTDRPRPAQVDHAGAMVAVELDEELTAGLNALSRRNGATLFMTLLAGWAVVLSRLSRQDDVVIGTPTAGRGRREIQGLIGFFVNTLALRVDLSGAPTGAELLAQVKNRALDAQQHQDIPFEQIVELLDPARSLSHNPVFQVVLAWQNVSRGAGCRSRGWRWAAWAPAPHRCRRSSTCRWSFRSGTGASRGVATYATALFERDDHRAPRWATCGGCWRRWPRTKPCAVERLALLPEASARWWWRGGTARAAYPGESCVHELFEQQVARTPDAVAVVFEGEQLSYGELNARANRLAHHLRALGVGPDVRVALCVERGAGDGGGPARGAQGGRRVRAAGPGVPGGAAGVHAGRQRAGRGADAGSDLSDRSSARTCRCWSWTRPRRRGRTQPATNPAVAARRRATWRTSSTPPARPAGPRA